MKDDDKPRKMKIKSDAEPGIEMDAHGNPIPFEERTEEDKAKAAAAAAVRGTKPSDA
jgi:hypothetical protein